MLDEALTELEALLNQERDAIRLLDGARVAEFARRKQSLVARLNASRNDFRPVDAARLKALTPALRQNGVSGLLRESEQAGRLLLRGS